MSGTYQDNKFWRRKLRSEAEPPRSVRGGGRKGCIGSRSDPFPGTYHLLNCQRHGAGKTWWDQLKNQRY